MKTRLIDFRPSIGGFSEPFGMLLCKMIFNMSFQYIGKIDAHFELEDTNSLNIGIWNSDDDISHLDKYYLGQKSSGRIGIATCHFSEIYLQSLSVIEMRLHILDVFHEMIVSFAKKFNEDDTLLWIAYEKMKTSDFYSRISDKKTSRNKKYTAWIEKRDDFDMDNYRLKIEDNITKQQNIFFIENKPPMELRRKRVSVDSPDYLNMLLNSIDNYRILGWKRDKFYFSWGDEENYEYDAQSNELKRI